MSEINIGNIQVNRTLGVGTANIPLLKGDKGDKGDTGYSISRIERTSGDGTPGTTDTYTIYIDTTPESVLATFTVHNGTDGGGDMMRSVYDTDLNGIVDNAEQVNGHTVGIDVPSNAVFTDTVYDDTALSGRVTTLENAGYITKSVADLANYYLKSETYTKQEVNNLCDMIPKFAIEVVSVLPTQDISETTIYLLRDDEETQDVYQEYIYVNNTWERIGGQRIDLSNYYQKNETYSKDELNGKLVNVGAEAPENGERVWFGKSKNLLDEKTLRQGSGFDLTNTSRVFFPDNYYMEPGTYTLYTNLDTTNYKYAVGIATTAYPNPTGYVYDTGWQTLDHVTFTLSQSGYLGVGVAKSDGTSDITPSDISNYNFMLYKGSYDSTISYEPYVDEGIYVDNEQMHFDNYSENEQVVGKWIDGKPLYRKVISFTPAGNIPANTWTTIFNYTFNNLKQLIKSTVLNTDSTNTGELNWLTVQYFANDNAFKGLHTRNMTVTLPTNSLIIVEYTKTTD